MFYVAQPLDDRELVDKNSVEVASLRLIEHARFLHRIDDGDLEPKLFDGFDDTRIVVKCIDEENPSAGMRDERLLSYLIQVPFSDAAIEREVSQLGYF
jgi:hypothetical protein